MDPGCDWRRSIWTISISIHSVHLDLLHIRFPVLGNAEVTCSRRDELMIDGSVAFGRPIVTTSTIYTTPDR